MSLSLSIYIYIYLYLSIYMYLSICLGGGRPGECRRGPRAVGTAHFDPGTAAALSRPEAL